MKTRADLETMVGNLYRRTGTDRFFEEPTVHIASAADPFFVRFKEIIGPFHWTPDEALRRKFPDSEAKSVIVWVLPVNRNARETNRAERQRPSVEWASSRSFGEILNNEMRAQLAKLLTQEGFPAVAPDLEPRELNNIPNPAEKPYTSNWSERHAAFVAGAGTFGLSASLITEHGVAMRLGSVVTALELPPDPRPYGDDPFAWCTRCGACIRRCPARAVGKEFADRDKPACANYAIHEIGRDREHAYGWMSRELGCALCQTGVPCEFRRPGSFLLKNR